MVSDFILMLQDIVLSVIQWFQRLNSSLGFTSYIIGIFLVYSIVRFVISPYLKTSVTEKGSDSVRKKKENE